MKSLVVYSSRTGNTRKVAQAIFEILPEPKEIHPVETAPPPDEFDFIALGFWANKGTADEAAQKYMKTINGKNVGVFGTLGAYPDSEHARKCMARVEKLLEGNHVHGGFMCQGKVDPDVVQMMAKVAPEKHPMTPERRNRLEEAKLHPDEKDLLNARTAFEAILEKL
ncbi:flavodoxin [Desulfonema ishimotonii]|uniref:Flavodoxin n=1 Tax=Desulfonema ishimotonii TaxID=45657 RepID=A0A401FV66_9BACT|nr:flavodoxin family protein [Desulfonema ishimotonii]GBC60859.1 flavodoxin [Desulfonema ishimotonii]